MDGFSIAEAGYATRHDVARKNDSGAAAMKHSTARSAHFWSETKWFAVYTKPRRENLAASNVSVLGVETLLPQVKVERLVAGVARTIAKPLFPSYLFARFCPQNSLESIEHCHGVLQVVSSGRFPIPVEEKVIDEIQGRIEKDGFFRFRSQVLGPGIRVTIGSGPFEGMMGRVERELDDGKRVAILLETLWHCRVLIERRWLDAVAA